MRILRATIIHRVADKFISRRTRRNHRITSPRVVSYRFRWNPPTLSQASPRRLAQWQLCLPHGSTVKLAHFCGLTCSFIAVKTLINSSVNSANFACDYYTSYCADKFISRKIRRTRRLLLKNNYIYRLRCRWNPPTLSQATPRRLAQWQLCLPHGSAVKLAHFCGLTCSSIAVKTLIKCSVDSANFL